MMNSKRLSAFVIAALGILVIVPFFIQKEKGISSESERNITQPKVRESKINFPSPFHNYKKVFRDTDGSLSEDLEKGYELEPYRSISDDDETVKLFAYLDNNRHIVEHPSLKIKKGDQDSLFLKGKEIFKAKHIYRYSISENNLVAVEAVLEEKTPTYKNPSIDFDVEKNYFPVSYGEIWLIRPNEEPYKLSPDNMNAAYPCLSKGGGQLSFSANVLDQTNSPVNEFLVVVDLEKNDVQYFNTPNMEKDHYTIFPVMWKNNDKTLRVVEDWGETAGHAQMGYIQFK